MILTFLDAFVFISLFFLMPYLLLITMSDTFLPAIKLILLLLQYMIKEHRP